MTSQKPLRDWAYLCVIAPQLLGMLVLDFVDFYPQSLYAHPSAPLHFLLTFRSFYVASTGDPFYASTSQSHAPWFSLFLYVELIVLFPLALYLVPRLASGTRLGGPAELAGLAFGLLTAVTSAACVAELYAMGPETLAVENRVQIVFGTYLPYAVIPAAMAVDMYTRLLSRVSETDVKTKTR